MTEEEIKALAERGAAVMYGKNWDSPDPSKRPGEKMKDVWRQYARDAQSVVLVLLSRSPSETDEPSQQQASVEPETGSES